MVNVKDSMENCAKLAEYIEAANKHFKEIDELRDKIIDVVQFKDIDKEELYVNFDCINNEVCLEFSPVSGIDIETILSIMKKKGYVDQEDFE